MTIFESIALVLAILVIAAAIAYYVQMGQLPMKDLLEKPNNQVVDEIEVTAPETVTPTPAKRKRYYAKKPKTQL
jgi:hypothetical protein